MMRGEWLLGVVCVVLAMEGGVGGQNEHCFCLEEIPSARNLRSPTVLENAGDGSNRLFIGEQVHSYIALID